MPNYAGVTENVMDQATGRPKGGACTAARRRTCGTAKVLALGVALGSPSAYAQHASDNVVAAADDAFGLSQGLEHVGMYSAGGIRGFDPQAAGNVRLDGLYFDQQGGLSNRVIENSSVRVGASEIGYAFPAPTGIVDYQLRQAGSGATGASVLASIGPFEAYGGSVDGTVPLIGGKVVLPIGVGFSHSTDTPNAPNAGYTSAVANFGTAPQWVPSDRVTVRALFDWKETSHARTLPIVFTAGDAIPPETPRRYLGQDWAEGRSFSENLGATLHLRLTPQWALAVGLFRSRADAPVSYSDLYVNAQMTALADHVVVGYPDQESVSTSGEIRLSGHFGHGEWRHDVTFQSRGRDTRAQYGGGDAADVGPAFFDRGAQAPGPAFAFSARTSDRTKLLSVGLAYRAQ